MKKKTKNSNLIKSIPYNFKRELSGYIYKNRIYYREGTRVHCPTFPDKQVVFHTHVDIQPTPTVLTFPDIPSPIDIIVFLATANSRMYIKTSRVFLTLKKTQKTNQLIPKIIRCIHENENFWKRMVKKNQHDRMFYFLLHYLKRNINRKNKVWNLSWKRIIENVFKIKVKIQTSDIKEHL